MPLNVHTIMGTVKYCKSTENKKTGKPIISFSCNVPSRMMNSNGMPRMNFFSVTCFGQLAESLVDNLFDDQVVVVSGEGSIDTWMDSTTNTEKKMYKLIANSVDVVSNGNTAAPVQRTEKASFEEPQLDITDPFSDQ